MSSPDRRAGASYAIQTHFHPGWNLAPSFGGCCSSSNFDENERFQSSGWLRFPECSNGSNSSHVLLVGSFSVGVFFFFFFCISFPKNTEISFRLALPSPSFLRSCKENN